jgi:hypothetical protein
MDYTPWPENGCTLAEARERTADRKVWNEWRRRRQDASKADVSAVEPQLGANCQEGLKSGRLLAYGRDGNAPELSQIIERDHWARVETIDWENSSAVVDGDRGRTVFDIRVFPPLLAPCRVDLLAGQPLAKVFNDFVLNDLEVHVLASQAVAVGPEWQRVFIEGLYTPYGLEGWPLAPSLFLPHFISHPDPNRRSAFDDPRPQPIEVVVAAEALKQRYRALISMLEAETICAEALNDKSGSREGILRSIWSHKGFYLDGRTGDILQENDRSEGRYDAFIKRYVGVVLQRPVRNIALQDETASSRSSPYLSRSDSPELLHVKPTAHSQLPSGTPKGSRRKSADDKQDRLVAAEQCRTWLEGIMGQSPHKRTRSKASLRAEAAKRWPPPALTRRQFDIVIWPQAIAAAEAMAWSDPGAPSKRPK